MKKITRRSKSVRQKTSGILKVGERRSLLAAISILGVSLGVTPAQPASGVVQTKEDSTQDSRTKIAETQTFKSNQLKSPTLQSSQAKYQSIQTKGSTLQSNQHKHRPNQLETKPSSLQTDQLKTKSPTSR